jgi:hypothetical protein
MNRHSSPQLRTGCTAAILAATAALALAGCGGSAPAASAGSAGGTTSGTSSAPATGGTTTSSAPAGTTAASASVPFPVGVGNTWVYKTDSALTGSSGSVTDKMTAVSAVSGGQRVSMLNTIDIDGTTTKNTAIYVFHADGSISYPIQNMGSSISVTGDSVFWPPASQMSSGTPYHSTLHLSLNANGALVRTTAHMTVQGEGTSSVTVPAGTYSATVVKMTESFTLQGHTSDIVITTWLASGVGPVQSEATLNELGANHVISELKLESFTKS